MMGLSSVSLVALLGSTVTVGSHNLFNRYLKNKSATSLADHLPTLARQI